SLFPSRCSPCLTLFPYTTLFRSLGLGLLLVEDSLGERGGVELVAVHAVAARFQSCKIDQIIDRPREPLRGQRHGVERALLPFGEDRKSTRLNSSHVSISYAVFCL